MSASASRTSARLGPPLQSLERPHAERDFEALRHDVLDGRPEAWRAFVERYSRHVYTIALHLSRFGEDREEIAQQIYLEVFERLARDNFRILLGFRGDSRFETYLFVIVRSAMGRHRRREVAERERTVPLQDEERGDGARVRRGTEPVSDDFSESIGLDPGRVASILKRALGELLPRERLALRLRFAEGIPLHRLAQIFGWRDSNAAAYEICRSLRKLDLIGRCRETLRWGEPEREVLLSLLKRWFEPPAAPGGGDASLSRGGPGE